MPCKWEGEVGHYDGGDNKVEHSGGGKKDKERCKWGRVAGHKTVALLRGLSIRCTCAGNTSTKNKAQKRLENKQPELDEVK
uniref:Uncharacterized protein n=1 Tax=Romanomermis culicivorax TaxID=13658 RepID=A0A915L1Y5_ROMCU